MTSGDARIKMLRWKSRRGMKELDVLLESFLIQQAEALKAGQWSALEILLDQEDDVFFDWISGRNMPENPELLELIETLTHVA
jgi:succinate dehydrogenase flavin-adding protein (antitoxin of CptAB toxin-antitoxin module)